MNDNLRKNDVPPVSAAEGVMIARAIMQRLNKVCVDKRKYNLNEVKRLISKYGFHNQMDFYGRNPENPHPDFDDDPFSGAYTNYDLVTKDIVWETFKERAQLIRVNTSFTSIGPELQSEPCFSTCSPILGRSTYIQRL
jgi:hypothetical protein